VQPLADRAPGPSRRLDAGDPIRVLATVAVVVQHVGHASFHHPARVGELEWGIATLVVGLTKWAVPVFVMLSGALLLEPRPAEPLAGFYRRRLSRVGVPLLFWSAFYLCLKGVGYLDEPERLRALPELLLQGRPFYHMFFLYVIVGLYLFTPMLRRFTANAGPGELGLAAALALGLAAGARLLGEAPGTALTLFVPYVGYYLAGRWLRERADAGAAADARAGSVFLLASAAIVVPSLLLYAPKGTATLYLHDYQSLPLMAASLAIFALLLVPGRFGPLAGRFQRACGRLAPLTLGIYLIHPAVLRVLWELAGVNGATGRVELAIPLVSAFAFAVSAAATAALRRVRPLAILVGG